MDFNWAKPPYECGGSLTEQEIEESFEDPFAIKIMPDASRFSVQARYFNLGRTNAGTGIISFYRTDGKMIQVIHSRAFDDEEAYFYQRKLNQSIS